MDALAGEDRPLPDDDEISLNSTLLSQHDSDEEFDVEQILYETEDEGDPSYLVEWTGYSLEEATWEPEENIPGVVLDDWRAAQERQARGEENRFDIACWRERVSRHLEAAYVRHRRRNVERKRRGMPLKLRQGESEEDYLLSDEDVGQDDYNAVFPPPKPSKRVDGSDEHRPDPPVKRTTLKKPNPARKWSSTGGKVRSPTRQKPPEPASQQRSRLTPATSTATGYQDTASKQTTTSDHASDRVATISGPAQAARKAKKTQVSSRKMDRSTKTGVNVFVSGKPPRTHARRDQAMPDAAKDTRMFNHRTKRKVELRSRDKEDQAPSSIPTRLFNISGGPPSGLGSVTSNSPLRSAMKRSADEMTTRSASESSVTASERTDSALPTNAEQARPTARKRKSVQWADPSPVDEPEFMDVDSSAVHQPRRLKSPSLPIESNSPPSERQPNQPVIRKLSIADYQLRSPGQSVDKAIVLGPLGSHDVQVTFENVRYESEPCHSHFVSQEVLHFANECNARTFASQRGAVVERVISHGIIRAKSPRDEGALNSAADRLRIGSFGAACFLEDLSIIVYPSGCEDWNTAVPEAEASSTGNVALRYLMYKPYLVAAKPLPERSLSSPKSTKPRATALENLLRIDYHRLTPPGLQDIRHNFYLLFPPSRLAMHDTLTEWLRAENPHCRVFSTKTAGDWAAFTDPKIVSHGVILVHEAAADSLRRFPGLLRLLLYQNNASYVFWCIGESLQQNPIYPSIRSIHQTEEPGTIELTRLFPHGSAILVTPSFLVAEPRRALQFFEWCSRSLRKATSNTKIVAASNLHQYLEKLALSKVEERKVLVATGDKSGRSKSAQEDLAHRSSLSHEDCVARIETCMIVGSLQQSFLDSIVLDEQIEPIIYADEWIDPNDEQSLVNWFGCWSQTRFDQFRKFHVLGTDSGSDVNLVINPEDLPKYSPGTERDLAAEARAEAQELGPTEQKRGVAEQGSSSGSKSMGNRSFWAFKEPLRSLSEGLKSSFAKLYSFPVSYFEDIPGTADSLRDFHRDFATYKKWWDFAWPFFSTAQPNHQPPPTNQTRRAAVFNTYLALFYTPRGEPREKSLARDPWIVVHRPQNPHLRWHGTEVIIWDIAAKERFAEGQDIFESDLSPAQQFLLKFVRQHSKEKNDGLPMKQVWLGGFEPAPSENTSPVDATMVTLEAMVKDLKMWLPAAGNLLPSRGFRPVLPDRSRAKRDAQIEAHPPEASQTDSIEGLHSRDANDSESKIIFHPPRSHKPTRPSQCQNLFYKWVRDVAMANPTGKQLVYTFRPTLEWYGEQQVSEGRHFEHIHVGNSQRIFDLMRLPIDSENKDRPEVQEETRK